MSRRAAVSLSSSSGPSQLLLAPSSLQRYQRTRFSSTMSQEARFAPGTNMTTMAPKLEPLLISGGGRWTLASEGGALERSFKFKTFAKTWDFMTAVSLQCKLKNHHPEWSNVYNTTFIRWTTHNPKGLSDKDVILAALCDALAKDFGELEQEAPSCEARNLADRAVSQAGDCCTPKK